MRRLFTILIATALTLSVVAQNRNITGKVSDAAGMGIPGVTVQLMGTTQGTTTDLDGKYQITMREGTLKFSYIGFVPQEVVVTNQTIINIVLLEQIQALDEVVVVGYGTQKKKDLTTAVSTVSEKEIAARPIVSATQALQGKAAGVQVVSPSGKPGAALSVRVRGATSVLAGNEPLYVVDGVPTTDIKGLNPNDIATMSVLKDASSSAIYGARAANGVVLITTKRGAENEPVVSFNTYFGASRLRKTIDVLTTKQYRELIDEISPGSLDPTATGYTDWSKETFGTGFNQSYQLSVSGGTSKSKYFVSSGYLSEQGIVKPARFDRYSVRINLDNEVRSWLKIGTSINVLRINTKDTPDNASSGRGGVIMSALNTPPFLHVYKGEGQAGFELTDKTWYDPNPFQPSWENPIAYMEGPDQESIDNQLFGNISAEAKIIEGLYLKSRFGVDINSHQWDYYLDPFRTNYGRKQNGIGQSDKSNSNTWLWENTLDYAKKFGVHNLTGLIGSSIQKHTWNDSFIWGNDYPANTSIKTLNAANIVEANTTITDWALASFFGRATYDYNSKYYLTMSVRRDGSSKLAHHWGTMPSFSAGWRISSEEFMKGLTFIDDLKLRGGWGLNGNQEGISEYVRYGLVSYYRRTPTNPLSGPSQAKTTYGNPDLKWETTAQTNIGIDLTMFNGRLTINIDAYSKKTRDVLLNVMLPSTATLTTIQTNAGKIENKGIEFNISSINMDKVIKWSTDFNMSFNRNKVTDLKFPGPYMYGKIYSNGAEVAIVDIGLPLGSFLGYISEGVDPATGDLIYKDVNENSIFDARDRVVMGDGQPDFTFGLTNNLSYRRFDFNVFFQGSYGNDIFNATRIDLEGMFDTKNQSVAVLRRWTPDNTDTDIHVPLAEAMLIMCKTRHGLLKTAHMLD